MNPYTGMPVESDIITNIKKTANKYIDRSFSTIALLKC